jgi:hypothetical protein
MRHRIVKGLLILGVVLGFGSGFAHLRHGHCGYRERAMRDFAAECTKAAREADHAPATKAGGETR